jgi:hypothetical protein
MMKVRLEGMALLAICALALQRLHMLVHNVPLHQASPTELVLGLVAALTGLCGAACLAIGPALFRPYAWPPADRD